MTGAGMSAESGIRTFRDANGLWEEHRIEDVATPEAFARNPSLVHRFYNARRAQLREVEPNAAHEALARLEREWKGGFLLVTQNVDDLHERAGSKKLLHMHGQLRSALCLSCEGRSSWLEDLVGEAVCPRCAQAGGLRPDIVWFGEVPYELEQIYAALSEADLFVSIGTSGQVYPAAGFAREAQAARRLEINRDETAVSTLFHESRRGLAATEVPKFVDEILRGASRS